MRKTWALALIVVVTAVGCWAPEPEPEPPRPIPKPSWWPDAGTRPDGMPWPPPKPPGWPDDKRWPPPADGSVDAENPQWWIDQYGAGDNPENDTPGRNGDAGTGSFANNFDNLLECDDTCTPGCNLFTLVQYDEKFLLCTPDGCTPYPGAAIKAHCEKAFDATTAEATCRTFCQRNRDRCRLHRLFKPPMAGKWSCSDGLCLDPNNPECEACTGKSRNTDCRAFFLCECWEN